MSRIIYVRKGDRGLSKFSTHLMPVDEDNMFLYLASDLWQDVVFFCLHICDNVPDLLAVDRETHSIRFYYHDASGILQELFGESLKGFFHRYDDFYYSIAPFFNRKIQEFMLDLNKDPLLFYGSTRTPTLREYWCK